MAKARLGLADKLMMLKRFKRFVAGMLEDIPASETELDDINLASAILFVEAMHADHENLPVERRAIEEGLSRLLSITLPEAQQLRIQAEEKMHHVVSLHEFVGLLNEEFSPAQKEKLIEGMWQVAHADSVLDKYEEHVIRRVAELLHVGHSAFIRAKLKVTEEGGEPINKETSD